MEKNKDEIELLMNKNDVDHLLDQIIEGKTLDQIQTSYPILKVVSEEDYNTIKKILKDK
jgi:hypothetical protein